MRKVTMGLFAKDYEAVLNEAEYDYLVVYVSVDGATPEMIVNHKDNVPAKMVYYRSAYDDNLRLKANPKIQIVDYQFATGEPSLDTYFRLGVEKS